MGAFFSLVLRGPRNQGGSSAPLPEALAGLLK
jgi:hypothetical protein